MKKMDSSNISSSAIVIRLGNFNADGEPGQEASLLFAEKVSAFMRRTVRDSEADYIEKLAAENMEVIEMDINEFRSRMQYAYGKMVSTGTVTQKQLDRMMEIVKNAR